MAKMIKFDLLINGNKVKNLEELQDNFTFEVVAIARSGRLTKWLLSRDENQMASDIQEALETSDDFEILRKIAKILDLRDDEEVLQELYNASLMSDKNVSAPLVNEGHVDIADFLSFIKREFFGGDSFAREINSVEWLNNKLSNYHKEKGMVLQDLEDEEFKVFRAKYDELNSIVKKINTLRKDIVSTHIGKLDGLLEQYDDLDVKLNFMGLKSNLMLAELEKSLEWAVYVGSIHDDYASKEQTMHDLQNQLKELQ